MILFGLFFLHQAMIIIDVLRRAGAEVTVASVESDAIVQCSRGVRIVADALIDDVRDQAFDVIALPGGMPGAERLRDSQALAAMMARHVAGVDENSDLAQYPVPVSA